MPHGGLRPGAGRPPMPENEKGTERVAVSVSLKPEERERLRVICAELDINQSDMMRFIIARPWLLTTPAAMLDNLQRKVERQ